MFSKLAYHLVQSRVWRHIAYTLHFDLFDSQRGWRTQKRAINFLKPKDLLYVPPDLTFRNSVFCSQYSYLFEWISEQTAIISLYSINLFVSITEAECLLRGTNWVFKSDGYSFVLKGLHWISFMVMTRPRIIWILNVACVIFTSLFIGLARGGSRLCGAWSLYKSRGPFWETE
jgi:hypothetical protein